jgi:prophage antirepressor-like protein
MKLDIYLMTTSQKVEWAMANFDTVLAETDKLIRERNTTKEALRDQLSLLRHVAEHQRIDHLIARPIIKVIEEIAAEQAERAVKNLSISVR